MVSLIHYIDQIPSPPPPPSNWQETVASISKMVSRNDRFESTTFRYADGSTNKNKKKNFEARKVISVPSLTKAV